MCLLTCIVYYFSRYTFVQYNEDPGLFAKNLYITLGSWLTIYIGLFLFYFWNLFDYDRPSYVSAIAIAIVHPLTLYLLKILRINFFAHSDIQMLFNFVLIMSGIEHYVSYLIETEMVVSKGQYVANKFLFDNFLSMIFFKMECRCQEQMSKQQMDLIYAKMTSQMEQMLYF